MIIEFEPKAKRNLVMTHDGKTINMHRGQYRTADKEEVRQLLGSAEYKNGAFEVKTPMELVEKWLSNEKPDKLTSKVLKNVDHKGLTKLANYLQLRNHGNYATVIRAMAEGEYIDNKVEEILKEHALEEPAEDLVEQAMEVGVIYKSGPWNKFVHPETKEEQSHGKSPKDISMFVEKNKDLVRKAIKLAKQQEE